MQQVISLSGPDEIGKTTQIQLLHKAVPKAGIIPPLKSYDSQWGKEGSSFEWWFGENNINEWLELIFRSLLSRGLDISNRFEDVVIVDRGYEMFIAVALAGIQIKTRVSEDEARKILDDFLKKNSIEAQTESSPIFLYRSSEIDTNVNLTMSRSNFSIPEPRFGLLNPL